MTAFYGAGNKILSKNFTLNCVIVTVIEVPTIVLSVYRAAPARLVFVLFAAALIVKTVRFF